MTFEDATRKMSLEELLLAFSKPTRPSPNTMKHVTVHFDEAANGVPATHEQDSSQNHPQTTQHYLKVVRSLCCCWTFSGDDLFWTFSGDRRNFP
jgi:hypothetical protein